MHIFSCDLPYRPRYTSDFDVFLGIINLRCDKTKHANFNAKESEQMSLLRLKGAEATCVKIATEMKKCSRLEEMANFNVL